ncbi:MAG: hypothetical protein ACTSRZ_00470 [Promethearchaeota archaeon]
MSLIIGFMPQKMGVKYEENPPRKLNLWFLAATLALFIRIYIASIQAGGIWTIKEQPELELMLDITSCFIISSIFMFILWLVQTLSLVIGKIKRPSRYVKAATGIFVFIPFFCLPIHALLPMGVSSSSELGLWIVIILILLFVIWNVIVLGIFLTSSKKATKRKAILICSVILVEEISLIFIFFVALPPLFESNVQEFFLIWF